MRRPIVLALAAACALGAGACTRTISGGFGGDGGRHPWTQPGTLRIATSLSPNTFNPILSTQQVEAFVQAFVFDPLVATDEKGRDVPVLAAAVPTPENGGVSRDGLTITYRLRRGVRWQDGAPFTSHDVAFSFRAVMNPATAVATRHGYDQVARVDTPDAYTAVFRLKRPFAPAVHTFFAHSDAPYYILPAHLLERLPDLNHVAFNEKPVGTGPFKLVRWLRGDRLEYAANDGYFLGKPQLRRIVVHLVPDENTIASQLRAHEIDWFSAATPRMYPQLTAMTGFTVRLVPTNASDAIMFNTKRAPFDDPNVRRAIGYAIDKRKLVQEVTFGSTVAATEDLPSFMWAFDPTAGTSGHHAAASNRLLDAAGWRRGPDGIRVKDGKRFEMGLAFRTDSITDRNRGVIIASMLKDAGIETELKGYTTSLLYGPPGSGILADGKFDAGLQTWYAGSDPDNSTQLTCDQVAPKGFNWTRYCDRAMDAAQRIALSHYDRPTRKRAYARIEQLLARDAPFVYLWWPRLIESVNTDLKNFRPNGIVENWNAYEWSI
ncbi:MAG: peptide/nickel transport system substrate-binding protein [Candidatus Eremiobacteraeota bacterium]|jgi:peptide/nickel transport system substrate-binding protein|nr:peptide/nickel transport system substrate-binding protein [Candidatus Eremiobacteraeota bacterium]